MNRRRRPASREGGGATTPRSRGIRIYTRTGDQGETGLIGGRRVSKDDPRVEAYGAIDELNAHLGAACARLADPDLVTLVQAIQNRLFDLGAELATPLPGKAAAVPPIAAQHVDVLERAIDQFEDALPPLREFILPSGSDAAAAFHVARTVARRAERRIVTLARTERLNPEILRYVNRLSDLLFVLARTVNQRAGQLDTVWRKST